MAGRLDACIGTIDGVNADFETKSAYIPGTLIVFLNGQQLDPIRDNGYTEIDPSLGTFRMKQAPVASQGLDDPGDSLFAFWQTGENVSIGGADGGVPTIVAGTHIKPELIVGTNLHPNVSKGIDTVIDAGTPNANATEIKPKIEGLDELKPNLVDSREV